MRAAHQRTLRPGTEWARYFPLGRLKHADPVVKKGDTFDTIVVMEQVIREYQSDTAELAPRLRRTTLRATCRAVWDWCYEHFQYQEDTLGVEQLRRPLRAWQDRRHGIDCDCFSILISTILLNLGIAHKLRKTKYNGRKEYQHIYVVVPDGNTHYTIDPVVDRFDYEVPYSAKFDKDMMPIQVLNGAPLPATATGGGAVIDTTAIRGRYRHLGFGAEFVGVGTESLMGLGAIGPVAQPVAVAAYAQAASVPTATAAAEVQAINDLAAEVVERTRQHLVNTLDVITATNERSLNWLADRIRKVLAVWDRPAERDNLLAEFAAEEEGLTGLGSLIGNVFGSVKNAVSQATSWVKDQAAQAVQAAQAGVSNATDWLKDKAGDIAHTLAKTNPLCALVRNALILAMKINLFRMAERLGHGYFSVQQAQAAGFDMGEFAKIQSALRNYQAVHVALGGEVEHLQPAILDGYHLGARHHNTPTLGRLGALGVEPVSTAAGTAAATPVIIQILDWLKAVDWDKLLKVANGVKKLLPEQKYDDPKLPVTYTPPASEQQYYADQLRYDKPPTSSGGGTSMVLVGGIALLVAALVAKPAKAA